MPGYEFELKSIARKTSRYALFTVIVLAITALADDSHAAYPQTITTTTPFVNLPRPNDDPRWAKAFAHWDKRNDTKEALAALSIVEEITKDNPKCFECRLWSCRMNYLLAMRKRKRRDDYSRKSIEAGTIALEIKPGNDLARYWRFCSIALLRDLSEQEYDEVAKLGAKYRHVRPLPIPTGDALWAEAVKKYDARKNPNRVLAAIEDFKKLDVKYPNGIESKLYIGMSYYWLAIIEPDKKRKAQLNRIGAEWARKAVELEPRNASANYVFIITIGRYVENTSMLAMVRHSSDIGKALVVVVEEDPTYMYGGFSRYLAASLAVAGELSLKVSEMLGFPKELILRITLFASKMEPAYLDNHLQLAKMYIALGETELAKASLTRVIDGDPKVLKYYEAENRIVKKEAQTLIQTINK